MEDAVSWYERFVEPIIDQLFSLGRFTMENPFFVLTVIVGLMILLVILRLVFKLAPFIIAIILIALLLTGGLGTAIFSWLG